MVQRCVREKKRITRVLGVDLFRLELGRVFNSKYRVQGISDDMVMMISR